MVTYDIYYDNKWVAKNSDFSSKKCLLEFLLKNYTKSVKSKYIIKESIVQLTKI